MQHPDTRQLQLFVAAELDAKEEKIIEAHLAQCPECAKRVSEWERKPLDLLMQDMKAVAASSDFEDSEIMDDAERSSPRGLSDSNSFTGGDLLAGYLQLEEKLGRGGMGEAWKASDLMAKRKVVIKLVSPEVRNVGAAMGQVREIFQKVHELQHQHICPVLGLGDDPACGVYLVMKFINGKTLDVYRKDYIAEHGRFSITEAVRILWDVACALDYSHEQKVLHRDVKPQNIMISPKDGVQLIDFGLAAEIRTSLMQVSETPMDMAGTRPYMAPEQWKGRLQDAKTDQYALAVTAYELIAGRKPFEGDDVAVLRECVLNELPEPIADVPEHINAALSKAMSKRRGDRFPDCMSFVSALTAQEPSNRRTNAWKIALGGAAACAVLLGLLFFQFPGRPTVEDSADAPAPVENIQFTAKGKAEIDEFCAAYGSDIKAVDEEGETLLHKAVKLDKIAVVKSLVAEGADVNAKDNDGKTPLDLAKERECTEIVDCLTNLADTLTAGHSAEVPAEIITAEEQAEIDKFCAEYGKDVKATDEEGRTLLHQAVDLGNFAVVKYLVSQGADVRARNARGDTLLHLASQKKSVEVVKFLVSQGADIRARSVLGSLPIHDAAGNGSVEVIEFLISQGTDIRAKDMLGETPIHKAAQRGNVENVKFLISQGVEMNAEINNGDTPLHVASWYGHLEVVKYLVSISANIRARNNRGGTPLHEAAEKGHLEIVKFLDSNGAEINAKANSENEIEFHAPKGTDTQGTKRIFNDFTPLHNAAFYGKLEVVKYLISQGAEVNAKTKDGKTALDIAKERGWSEIVDYFSNSAEAPAEFTAAEQAEIDKFCATYGKDVKARYDGGKTLLHYAVDRGNLAVVKYLVSQEADVNAKDKDRFTPLFAALDGQHVEVIKFLVSQGADLNAKARGDDITPLVIAAGRGNLELAKLLISQGADVNMARNDGVTPLYEAVWGGRTEMVKFLVSQGANLEACRNDGDTPLHLAAHRGYLEIAKFLVSHGAKVDSKRCSDGTPLWNAASQGRVEVVKFLVSQGADVNAKADDGRTALDAAKEKGHTAVVEYLIAAPDPANIDKFCAEYGKDVNAADKDGRTLLHKAVAWDIPVIQYLLSEGAEVNAKDNNGRTPLADATRGGYSEVVQFLISEKAEVNAKDKDGRTPLFWAIEGDNNKMVEFLVSEGADIHAKTTTWGLFPLHIAAIRGNLEVVKLLVSKGAEVNAKNKDGKTSLDLAKEQGHTIIVEYLSRVGGGPKTAE